MLFSQSIIKKNIFFIHAIEICYAGYEIDNLKAEKLFSVPVPSNVIYF